MKPITVPRRWKPPDPLPFVLGRCFDCDVKPVWLKHRNEPGWSYNPGPFAAQVAALLNGVDGVDAAFSRSQFVFLRTAEDVAGASAATSAHATSLDGPRKRFHDKG